MLLRTEVGAGSAEGDPDVPRYCATLHSVMTFRPLPGYGSIYPDIISSSCLRMATCRLSDSGSPVLPRSA